MSSGEVEDEIVLPGLVGEGGDSTQGFGLPLGRIQLGVGLGNGNADQEDEIASDDEEVCCFD